MANIHDLTVDYSASSAMDFIDFQETVEKYILSSSKNNFDFVINELESRANENRDKNVIDLFKKIGEYRESNSLFLPNTERNILLYKEDVEIIDFNENASMEEMKNYFKYSLKDFDNEYKRIEKELDIYGGQRNDYLQALKETYNSLSKYVNEDLSFVNNIDPVSDALFELRGLFPNIEGFINITNKSMIRDELIKSRVGLIPDLTGYAPDWNHDAIANDVINKGYELTGEVNIQKLADEIKEFKGIGERFDSSDSVKNDLLSNNESILDSYLDLIKNSIDNEKNEDKIVNGEYIIGKLVGLKEQNRCGISLGLMGKTELTKLTADELSNKLVEQLSSINLQNAKERQEFFKFISGFKSNKYTYKNSMLLLAQAEQRGLSNVFATMKEWNGKDTRIKAGNKAMLIRMPSKSTLYFEKNENGDFVLLPKTYAKDEIAERERKVKAGEAKKKEVTSFFFNPVIFSIDQTTMEESERITYLQRYNAHNTSEENADVLKKEKSLCEALGINVRIADDSIAAIGFLAYQYNEIYLKEDMPVDSQISTLTHELGHYLFHRHEEVNEMLYKGKKKDNPYLLSHKNREIQAQLFSHVVLEGLGIDTESDNSLKYINSYLSIDENTHKVLSINDVSKNVLNAHLNIVVGEANKFAKIVQQSEFSEKDIKELQDFMPDRFLFDQATNKATVILNSTIEGQSVAQRKQETKQQKVNEQKHFNRRTMIQSM